MFHESNPSSDRVVSRIERSSAWLVFFRQATRKPWLIVIKKLANSAGE
jgi:hypothetical protein